MKKNVLVFGLISGLVVSAIMSIGMVTLKGDEGVQLSNNFMMAVGYLSMLISFSFIYVAVKNFRDKQNGGLISIGHAFKMGLLITLIGATIYVISWALLYNFYMPDFMDKYCNQIVEEAKATSSPAELQKLTEKMDQQKELYKNPFFFTLFTYMEILPVGLIVSLICAFILKRKKAAVV
jgi:hypothetical protein